MKTKLLAALAPIALIAGGALYLAPASNDAPSMAAKAMVETTPEVAALAPAEAISGGINMALKTSNAPVVFELFTSQGCSSCPPADRVASQLAQRDDVIVITRPVTYWDRLGWKDTLARESNTSLQRSYARRGLAGDNGVYTPQAVINGRSGAIGSRRGEVNGLISGANGRRAPVLSLDSANNRVTISGPANGSARLALVGISNHESVSIGRGENGNRTLNYTNVYLGERNLGNWSGGSQSIALPSNLRGDLAGADKYALILRDGSSGPILAGKLCSKSVCGGNS